jgi:parvulin-like peptidyl-prolyl isomerase
MAKSSKIAPPNPAPRRLGPKQLREQRRQRMVIVGTGVALGLALIALLTGLLYQFVYIPNQTVASVNSATLSRRAYWQERRQQAAREIMQSLQLDALLAGQDLGQDFTARIPVLNQQLAQIRTLPEDEATLGGWQTRQLIEQGAQERGLNVSDADVKQQLVGDLASVFLPDQAAAQTPTSTPLPTEPAASEALTGTDSLSATAVVTPTSAPTPTLRPTVTADQASTQAEQIFDAVFDRYRGEIEATGENVELSRDDFVRGITDQYRQQALTTRIQEQLVPEAGFTPETTPKEVKARHILVQIPDDTPEDQREAAYAEARQEADQIYAQLQQGADFATLAAERSDDPGSKDQGGDLGFFGENSGFDPDFVAAAFALADGEISQPVRTQFGWHIIQTLERRADPVEQQLSTRRTEEFDKWLNERRAAATLVPVPTPSPTTEPTVPPLPTPEPPPALEPTPEATGTPTP